MCYYCLRAATGNKTPAGFPSLRLKPNTLTYTGDNRKIDKNHFWKQFGSFLELNM